MIDTTQVILAHLDLDDDIIVQFSCWAILLSLVARSLSWIFKGGDE